MAYAAHAYRGRSFFLVLVSFLLATPNLAWSQWNDGQKLLASDGVEDQEFGNSLSAAGNAVLVGANLDSENGDSAGAAYVIRFDGSEWFEEQKLLAGDGQAGDKFGYSVSLSADVAIVGAWGHDAVGSNSGAAYVFRFDGMNWNQEQKLLPSDAAASDQFGISVGISGDAIVVGSNLDDDNGTASGSAYVFRFDGSSWIEEQKLLPSDGEVIDQFGEAVAISGATVVVGARQDDDNGSDSGSVYVFRHDGTNWNEEQKLLASDGAASERFGSQVAVDDNTLVVGVDWDGDNGAASGSAYVFSVNGSTWLQQAKLLPSDGATGDHFGISVAVSAGTVLVGAYWDDVNEQDDQGSAYAFHFDGSAWGQEQKLTAFDGFFWDFFGNSVALSDNIAVIGSFSDSNPNGPDSGAIYFFAHEDPGIIDCNGNDIPDDEDIAGGDSEDCDGNLVPDECQSDQDADGTIDACDGCANDPEKIDPGICGCGNPDNDTDADGIADCEDNCPIDANPDQADCDDNGMGDVCELVEGISEDCNSNNVPDGCDIDDGTSQDQNGDSIPDECDTACAADLDGNGTVDINDMLQLLTEWGPNPASPADLNGDGVVDISDLLSLMGSWGPC